MAENGGLLGAGMVTNERGYPLEFRVTTPVRATAVQKALYGKSLEPYIITELIGRQILLELEQQPALILTNRLSALEIPCDVPLLFIAHEDGFVLTSDDRYQRRRLDPFVDGMLSLAVSSLMSSMETDQSIATLGRALRYFDPVEAFERMRTAVDVLAQSDARYR